MTILKPAIQLNSQVTLHFSLSTESDIEIMSTFGEEPVTITTGQGELVEGLELALYGLREGDQQTLAIGPELMYGSRKKDLQRSIPLSDFAPSSPPEVGQVIAFKDEEGAESAGVILALENKMAQVDFNHPLAGMEVSVKIEILKVEHLEQGET